MGKAEPLRDDAEPSRDDYEATGLRKLARRCRDDRQSCRLLAIASIHGGMSRADAARIGGMDRQTLRDWVVRFNEAGPAGLKDRWVARPRRLTGEQMKELAEIVETGPDSDVDGVGAGGGSLFTGPSETASVSPVMNAPSPNCSRLWVFPT